MTKPILEKKIKPRIIPILINCQEEGKQIGIEYKDGKYILFGKEFMDEGVNNFFNALKPKLETLLEAQQAQLEKRVGEIIGEDEIVFNHRVGSHSDDYGGDSDLPCNCQKDAETRNQLRKQQRQRLSEKMEKL